MSNSIKIKQASGFSLIEVLVAVVVLSIGLVGLAGLQAKSLVNGVSASYRTQATLLGKDLAEKMRVNSGATFQQTYYDNPTETETTDCEAAAGCTSSEMVEHDYFRWKAAVSERLPSGDGTVCIDNTPNDGTTASTGCDGIGNNYAIKIWWDDGRTGTADNLVVTVLRAAW